MTSGGPPAQYGLGPGGPVPSGPNQSVGGHGTQPGGWGGGYGAPPPPPRRGGKLASIGIVVAVVLSAAALVVGVVALTRQPEPSATATPTTAPVTSPAGDTSAADKALCEEVGPLLREVVDTGKRFVALGDPGTPQRDAAIPTFRAEIIDWADRIQPILEKHPQSSGYLRRTLQTEVDFKQLYATNIRPGPELNTDAQAWNIAAIAHGGPWEICHALGVTW